MLQNRAITFVLTSCGRFDLLAETILTFLEFNTAPVARYVVVEDSGDASVRDVLGGVGVKLEFLVNDPPRGQIASIDRAYAGIDTPWIFHCEDDWRFFRRGFVEESMHLLEQFADISAVMCRRTGQNDDHDRIVASASLSRLQGIEFRKPAVDAHAIWFGYGFNPGLRRLADYRAIGSFAALGHEPQVSLWFKHRGMGMAALEHPACETTGKLRHVRRALLRPADITPPPPPDTMPAPASRNASCPCGSGERYKNCHGARR